MPFKAKYFGAVDSALYQAATNLTKQANKGLISHQDFIDGAAKLANLSVAEAQDLISRNVADEELFAYARELKKDYKLGFLSNIAEDYLTRMFSKEQIDLFDVIELSYKTGYVKPEVGAYAGIIEKLGVKPEETIMVDDQERNVAGALEAGMRAILYTDARQLKSDLKPLLAV